MQINSKNLNSEFHHLAKPPSGTTSGGAEKIEHLPANIKNELRKMYDPKLNIAKAMRMYREAGYQP
jgi:hypothetical protein